MPDWHKLVHGRLPQLALDATEREDICAELAAHLEDAYNYAVAAGASDEVALALALRQVTNWRQLKSQIESARKQEPPMNKRTSQFWFPGFLTILLAMVFLMVIEKIGPKPLVLTGWRGSPRVTPVALVYFSWLVTLPFIGALGAWLSLRAGGRPRAVFSSVVFPVLPYFAFFIVGLPIAIILDDHVAHNITLPAFFVGLGAWVILPAIALLAGGLSVHLWRRLNSGNIAHS